MEVLKKCSKCKVEKSLIEFHHDKTKQSGYYNSCKLCKNITTKKLGLKYSRLETREIKEKKVCSRCKEEKTVLEFVKNRYQKDGFANECKKCQHNYYITHSKARR